MILRGEINQKAGRVLLINSNAEIIHILEVNLTNADLEVSSALNGAEALSKVHNDKPDIIILDPELPDIDSNEICQQIIESSQTSHTPIVIISAKPQGENGMFKVKETAIYYIIKPFDPKEIVALIQGFIIHKERMANISPLTRLPNKIQVNKEIARLIRQKTTFAAIYLEMHDFKAINKVYGYIQGDRVIQLLAEIVSEAVRLFGNPEDLAGHFSGDRFVIISTPWKARTLCRRIIADFNRSIKVLYTDEHLQVGHTAYENISDSKERTPIMSIHLAVVTNEKRKFQHYLEVTEVASEQIDYLRRSLESNCYFDLKVNGIEPSLEVAHREILRAQKEELEAIRGVLAWLDFLAGELNIPITSMKDCLCLLESIKTENLSKKQLNSIKMLQGNHNRLTRIVEGIIDLAKADLLRDSVFFDELNVDDIIRWVLEQVQELAEQREIKTDLEVIGEIGQVIGDERALTQSLLYVMRNEIQSSPIKSHLYIRLFEKNQEFFNIVITNPQHYIFTRELNSLLKDQYDTSQQEILKNKLYLARILVRSLGGKLEITSKRKRGTTYIVKVPKKWQSWMYEVDNLRLAMEISRKEARDTLKNVQHLVLSLVEHEPPEMKVAYNRIDSKIKELGVLCNRSLFLADDLSIRLEVQQDRLLQQGVEQFSILEVILTICRDIAHSMHLENIFDLDSTKRVAKYALSIANVFKMSESDRQALRYAVLFKDLGLVLSPNEMMEQMIVSKIEEAIAIKARYDVLWKALSTIHFLTTTLDFVRYKYEKYDGTGGRFSVKGTDIPLGARILAIADDFDAMTSGQSTRSKLNPRLAVQKIAKDSGSRFDPHIVSAFLMLYKKKII